MSGDVVVLGLVSPSHFLTDIQTEVPHMGQVVISGEKAIHSKDLWRAISSRQIYQLNILPNQPRSVMPSTLEADLRGRIAELEVENRVLKATLLESQSAQKPTVDYTAQQEKLDAILRMVSNPGFSSAPASNLRPGPSDQIKDESILFIPSSITPVGAETRIELKTEESESSGVSGAASRLRDLRKKQGSQ